MLCFLFALLLSEGAFAQPSPSGGGGHDGMGNGIAKSTHACSEKVATSARAWMEKYMPLSDADDDCTNHVCQCGIQSRVETKSEFGIHCTYAYGKDHSRENANGGMSVEEIEGVFTSKLGDWSTYDSDANVRAWSDYHTQFFKYGGLDSLVSEFQKDGVKFHSGSWTEDSTTFYSVVFQVPSSQVVLEIWSDSCSTCGSSIFAETRQRQASTLSAKGSSSSSNSFFATQVSRAVDDLDIVIDFYKKSFSLSPTVSETLSDGSSYVDFNFGTEVDIRYFKRAGQSGAQTTSWFQSQLVNTSKTYMTGVSACWPIWGDNHFAYDGAFKTQSVLDGAKSSTFGSYFKPVEAGPAVQAYLLEPSGWQIQLDGMYTAPSGTEGFNPEYCSTSCQSNSSLASPSPAPMTSSKITIV